MMNTRIIELLQQPKLITSQDLTLLENQIQQHPYIQNIRALYLYGIHQYQPHRYKEILTKTAAYTTDKKILYQFVNQKIYQKSQEKLKENSDQKSADILPIAKSIVVEEMQILDKEAKHTIEDEEVLDTEPIDATGIKQLIEDITDNSISKEATIVVSEGLIAEEQELPLINDELENLEVETNDTEKIEVNTINEEQLAPLNEVVDDAKVEVVEVENIETNVINEQQLTQQEIVEEVIVEKLEVADQAISFDAIDDFLPNVKFTVPKNHNTFLNPPKFDQPKEQNEAIENSSLSIDLKEEKVSDIVSVDEVISELESKEISNSESLDKANEVDNLEVQETLIPVPKVVVEASPKVWQPMQFDNHLPDALIGKSVEDTIPAKATVSVDQPIIEEEKVIDNHEKQKLEVKESIHEEPSVEIASEDSRPIMNVSFFSDGLSIISEATKVSSIGDKSIVKDDNNSVASNVGKFINTWQSWLKIDRTDETDKETEKEIQKNKVIEQFIENQPKISQLKDEVSFVVKEKKEDISHLMTETLANLYLEQRLYTKAIKAFEILIVKHPEKKKHFLTRIEEIKIIRKSI